MNAGSRRGVYRIRGIGGLPDEVQVEDSSGNAPIPASQYIARRYLPRLDDLPWQEDYFAQRAEAKKAEKDSSAEEPSEG